MVGIKVGIIGAGQISSLHAAGYRKDPRVSIGAVCDVREGLAIERALEWESDTAHTDIKHVLGDASIHAVDICAPNYLHAPIAMAALRAGKHVMVQRPLALTVAEADKLIAEAARQRLVLCMAEPLYFHTPLIDARSYLEAGEIGDPVSVRIKTSMGAPEGGWKVRPESWLWRFDPKKAGGGPFLFDAIYGGLAAAHRLLEGVNQLHAWLGQTEIYPGYFIDAPGVLMWRHAKSSCHGSMDLTYSPELYIRSSHYPNDVRVEVTGTRGILRARLAPGNVTMSAPLEMYRDGRLFSFGEIVEDWAENFNRATSNFVDAILGEDPARCPGEVGRELLRTTLAVRESSQSGQPQTL